MKPRLGIIDIDTLLVDLWLIFLQRLNLLIYLCIDLLLFAILLSHIMRVIFLSSLNLLFPLNLLYLFLQLEFLILKHPFSRKRFSASRPPLLAVSDLLLPLCNLLFKPPFLCSFRIIMGSSQIFNFLLPSLFESFDFIQFGQVLLVLLSLFFLRLNLLILLMKLLNRALTGPTFLLANSLDSFNSQLLFRLFLKGFVIIFTKQDLAILADLRLGILTLLRGKRLRNALHLVVDRGLLELAYEIALGVIDFSDEMASIVIIIKELCVLLLIHVFYFSAQKFVINLIYYFEKLGLAYFFTD